MFCSNRNAPGRDIGAPKKKNVIVREILDAHCLKPDEVIFVGDAMSDYHAASENSIRFIARIHDNESIFKGIECIKIMDLTGLGRIINEDADTGRHARKLKMLPEDALLVATHNADSTREEAQYFLRFVRQQGFKKVSSQFHPGEWWKHRADSRTFFYEFSKIIWYTLAE